MIKKYITHTYRLFDEATKTHVKDVPSLREFEYGDEILVNAGTDNELRYTVESVVHTDLIESGLFVTYLYCSREEGYIEADFENEAIIEYMNTKLIPIYMEAVADLVKLSDSFTEEE